MRTFLQGILLTTAKANVTAGFMWAPTKKYYQFTGLSKMWWFTSAKQINYLLKPNADAYYQINQQHKSSQNWLFLQRWRFTLSGIGDFLPNRCRLLKSFLILTDLQTWNPSGPVAAKSDTNPPAEVDWEKCSKLPVTKNHLSHWSYSKDLQNERNTILHLNTVKLRLPFFAAGGSITCSSETENHPRDISLILTPGFTPRKQYLFHLSWHE